jgi:hypothetical protein
MTKIQCAKNQDLRHEKALVIGHLPHDRPSDQLSPRTPVAIVSRERRATLHFSSSCPRFWSNALRAPFLDTPIRHLELRCLKPANAFALILLQTLCRCRRAQLLCNQANPNSFHKMPAYGIRRSSWRTPGVGSTSQSPSHRISDLQTLLFLVFAKWPFSRSTKLHSSCSRVTDHGSRVSLCPRATSLSALSFHTLTNCFSRKPFRFTFIRIARGWHHSVSQ